MKILARLSFNNTNGIFIYNWISVWQKFERTTPHWNIRINFRNTTQLGQRWHNACGSQYNASGRKKLNVKGLVALIDF